MRYHLFVNFLLLSCDLKIELVDEFLWLGDASVLEISLGFAHEKNPLVFIGREELLEYIDGKKGRVESVFVGIEIFRVCNGVQSCSDLFVLSLAIS